VSCICTVVHAWFHVRTCVNSNRFWRWLWLVKLSRRSHKCPESESFGIFFFKLIKMDQFFTRDCISRGIVVRKPDAQSLHAACCMLRVRTQVFRGARGTCKRARTGGLPGCWWFNSPKGVGGSIAQRGGWFNSARRWVVQ
jgi:hypothetical protein